MRSAGSRVPWLVEDGGGAHFSDQEVIQLREYLLKGGFLFASDYWGTRAGRQWEQEIGRVLPPERYSIVDIPNDHPIWRDGSAKRPILSTSTFSRLTHTQWASTS